MTLLAEARALLLDVVDVRRRIHRRPELGLALPATQALVVDSLRALGLDPRYGTILSSVTVVIDEEAMAIGAALYAKAALEL